MDSDVVVVGSGGAGLAAALAAATRGARVTVLERAPVFGGATAISGGGMWLPCNPFQAADGYPDDPEEVSQYLHTLSLGLVDDAVIRAFVAQAPKLIEFLQQETELTFDGLIFPDYHSELPGGRSGILPGRNRPAVGRTIQPRLYDSARLGALYQSQRRPALHGGMKPVLDADPGNVSGLVGNLDLAKERMEKGVLGRGQALIAGLLGAAAKKGVKLVPNARARHLVKRDGRVTGVVVERDGKEEIVGATRGVILASGGLEWNRPLWDKLIGLPLDQPLTPPWNEGDAFIMASEVGARIANFGVVWRAGLTIPGETYDGRPFGRVGRGKWAGGTIVVNRKGRRFANELASYNDFGKAMASFDPQTNEFANHPAFVIFDRELRKLSNWLVIGEADPESVISDSWLTEAPTLRELAQRMGIDPAGLDAQVAEFNDQAVHGTDPFGTGRTGTGERSRPFMDTGPYYGYILRASCFGTRVGPVINEHAQLTDYQERPIPGLYAAGSAAAMLGQANPARGGNLGPVVTFGYVAGNSSTMS